MNMSHVAMGYHSCVVCGDEFESGEVVLDKKLRPIFDGSKKLITDFGLCPECTTQSQNNTWIALVEINPAKCKTKAAPGLSLSPADAWRTGRIMWVKRERLTGLTTRPLPEQAAMYIDIGVIEMLKGEDPPHRTVQ